MASEGKRYPSPFCLRLTFEERARLEKAAAGSSLGAYVRQRLFNGNAAPRRTRGKHPVKDHEALGRVLAELGRSRIASNLNQLTRAANSGSLPTTPEVEALVLDVRRDVDDYYDYARQEGLRIAFAADTHQHNDYLAGIMELQQRSPVELLASARAELGYKARSLRQASGSQPARDLLAGVLQVAAGRFSMP